MALGTESVWKKGAGPRRQGSVSTFSKKIAVQFTPDQFCEINSFADSKGVSFSAAVRRLIFEIGPFQKDPA